MLLLTSINDSVFIAVTGSVDLQCYVSYVDKDSTITPGRQNTLITTAGNTEICSAPAAEIQRNVRGIVIRNEHASGVVVDVRHTDGVTPLTLWKGTLASQEHVSMSADRNWHIYRATGTEDSGISLADVNLEGENKSFIYNASGQLTSISGSTKQIAITYTPSGNISTIQKTYEGSVVTTTLGYNVEGNLESVTVT